MIIELMAQFGSGGDNPTAVIQPPSPIVLQAKTSTTTIGWAAINGATSYVWQIADNALFANATQSSGLVLTVDYLGLSPNSQFFFRAKTVTATGESLWGSISFLVDELQDIQVSNLILTPADTAISATWSNPALGFSAILVEYKLVSSGTWTTFSDTGTPTSASITALTNNSPYDVRITPIPEIDYNGISITDTSTPSGVPQLNAPTALSFNDLGFGNVEISTTYNGEVSVTYVIERNEMQVSSSTSNPVTVGGFVDDTIYPMRVKVQKVGFEDSNWYNENYSHNPIASFDDLSNFGIEIFHEFYEDTLTVSPLGNGTSRITRSGGTPFTADFVGKEFESFRIHQNPATYPATGDNYIPRATTARYATVANFEDANNLIVDFEFNGGNDVTPMATNGTGGSFFKDNLIAYNQWLINPTRQEQGRVNGILTMKGFPSAVISKDLEVRDGNGLKYEVRIKHFWSDSFDVSEKGNSGCPTWGANFGSGNVYQYGNGTINIDLPQILPTFFCTPSVQFVTKAVTLLIDTSGTASTANGIKKTYNANMYEQRDSMSPALSATIDFLLPNRDYSVGGGVDDGNDITAFNTHELEGGWTSLSPTNVKAKYKSGVKYNIFGTAQNPSQFIERESLKPTRFNGIMTKFIDNRTTVVEDDLFTFYSVANQYWGGGTSTSSTNPNLIEIDGFKIYYGNNGDWREENNSTSFSKSIGGDTAELFERIPQVNEVIDLGVANVASVNGDRINVWGYGVQVGDTVEINAATFQVVTRSKKFSNSGTVSGYVHYWELTLDGTPNIGATQATILTSQTAYLLDGLLRSANHVYEGDANNHLMYTDQETNMEWSNVLYNGFIRATGEYRERVEISGLVGTFTASEIITDNLGNTGNFVDMDSAIEINYTGFVFANGATLTGSNSGATATVVSVNTPLLRMTSQADFTNCFLVDEYLNPAYSQGREYNPASLKRREEVTGNSLYRVKISGGRMYWSRLNEQHPNVEFSNKPHLVYGTSSYGEPRLLNPVIGDTLGLIIGSGDGTTLPINSVGAAFQLTNGNTIDLSNSELRGQLNLVGDGTFTINNMIGTLIFGTTDYEQIATNFAVGGIVLPNDNNLTLIGDGGSLGVRNLFDYPIGKFNVILTNWTLRKSRFNNDGFSTAQNTADPLYCNYISINGACLT